MAIEFQCPGCAKAYSVPEEHAGRQVLCPACSALMRIPSAAVPPLLPPSGGVPPLPGAGPLTPTEVIPAETPPGHHTLDLAPAIRPAAALREYPAPSLPGSGLPAVPQIHVTVLAGPPPPPAPPEPPPLPRPSKPSWARAEIPDNSPVFACCMLLLATIVVPWWLEGDQPVWSWNVLRDLPASVATFVVGEWIIAGIVALLAMMISGGPFSAVLTALASLGLALLLQIPTDMRQLGIMPREVFSRPAGQGPPLLLVAVGAALLLYAVGSVRLRVPTSIALMVLEGIVGAICTALTGLTCAASLRVFLDEVRKSSLLDVVSGLGAIPGVSAIAFGFAALAGVLAALHACGVQRGQSTYTRGALALLRTALGLVLLAAVVFAGIEAHTAVASLTAAVVLVLGLGMPVLFVLGLTRLLGELFAVL